MKNMNIYVYKMVVDNGGAPCVSNGLLTLAICKPMIRKMAAVGSLIFGFGGIGKDYDERLIYIAEVTDKLEKSDYYRQPQYARRRDCIYHVVNGRPVVKNDARYHRNGDQLQHDVGFNFERAFVLVSRNFRYLGKQGTKNYQTEIAKLIKSMKRGHRVNYSPEVFEELIKLKTQIWKDLPDNFKGEPTDTDLSKPCNDSSGSCRCETSD